MIALALLAACLQPVNTGVDCAACHGAGTGVPPPALGGATDTTYIGVGAHARHDSVGCAECHVVPDSIDAPDHLGSWPAEVRWGDLAATGGASTPWVHDDATCTVYCHGATFDATPPSWTVVDGTQVVCGTCHGLPPPPPHVTDTACEGCHAPTAGPDGTIADFSTHIDGVLQTGTTESCGGCHGTDENPAPPPDTAGNTASTFRGVGAHAAHLAPANAAPVECEVCHVVPAAQADPGHIDASPAEVAMTGLAAQGAADPVWDSNALTCSDSYCHGGTLGGGDLDTPVWTETDGAAAECGACHGMPPPSPHPSGTNCSGCHASAGPGQTIDQPARHIDGSAP